MPFVFTETGALIWRDFNVDGVPGSGKYSPRKADIRTWAGEVEGALDELKDDTEVAVWKGLLPAVANQGVYFTGTNAAAKYTLTSFMRTLSAAATDAAARTTLGVPATASVQPVNANLTSLAGLTFAANKGLYTTGANTAALFDLTAAGRALLDDADTTAQRNTLGLTVAQLPPGNDLEQAIPGVWGRFNVSTLGRPPPSNSAGYYFTTMGDGATGNARLQIAFTTSYGVVAQVAELHVRVQRNGVYDQWKRIGLDADAVAPSWKEVGPVAATGAAVDFTSIPAGVSEVDVSFVGVSFSGTDSLLLQLGSGGAPQATGYNSAFTISTTNAGATTGFQTTAITGALAFTGEYRCTRLTGNEWACTFIGRGSPGAGVGGGEVTLTGELNNLRLRPNAASTFDSGQIKLRYR